MVLVFKRRDRWCIYLGVEDLSLSAAIVHYCIVKSTALVYCLVVKDNFPIWEARGTDSERQIGIQYDDTVLDQYSNVHCTTAQLQYAVYFMP